MGGWGEEARKLCPKETERLAIHYSGARNLKEITSGKGWSRLKLHLFPHCALYDPWHMSPPSAGWSHDPRRSMQFDFSNNWDNERERSGDTGISCLLTRSSETPVKQQ